MSLPTTPPLGLDRIFNKGHTVEFQEADGLPVVLSRGCDGYLQTTDLVYLIVIDLRKDDLLPETSSIRIGTIWSTTMTPSRTRFTPRVGRGTGSRIA